MFVSNCVIPIIFNFEFETWVGFGWLYELTGVEEVLYGDKLRMYLLKVRNHLVKCFQFY